MLTRALDDDIIGGDVLKPFRASKKKFKVSGNERSRYVTVEEYLKLFNHALPHLKAALIIAYNSGMRLGEIRTLKFSDIEKKVGVVRVKAENTKSKKSKVVPINDFVREALPLLPMAIDHEYVIHFRCRPIDSQDGFKHSLKTTAEQAGIP